MGPGMPQAAYPARLGCICSSCTLTTSRLPIKSPSVSLINRWYLTPAKMQHLSNTKKNPVLERMEAAGRQQTLLVGVASRETVVGHWCNKTAEMTNCHLKEQPGVVLSNSWEEGSISHKKNQIIAILLALAKVEIASKWKSTSKPSLGNRHDRIWGIEEVLQRKS